MARVEIQPRVLKGFRDTLPDVAQAREEIARLLRDVFVSFGFLPIDTPALEYADILLGKGSYETDRQLYRFLDNGKRDVAMRFDLTVPLARFVAMHAAELSFPFRRYHIASVWRAEKPQRGRFREFIQCDFDTVGTHSVIADVEIVTLIHRAFSALGLEHSIKVNNRLVLNGLLDDLGVREKSVEVLRAIDKLEKLGEEVVRAELEGKAGFGKEQSERLFYFLGLSSESTEPMELLGEVEKCLDGGDAAKKGLSQLREMLTLLYDSCVEKSVLRVDFSIARGLDYYTSSVFETQLKELPGIGSVCSGGRYDNLAGLYTRLELPGVGASIGLDRLIAAMGELHRLDEKRASARLFILLLDEGTEGRLLSLASKLRNDGHRVEVYPEIAKIGTQLKYADRRGIPFAVIAGKAEIEKGLCSIKELATRRQKDDVPLDEIEAALESFQQR